MVHLRGIVEQSTPNTESQLAQIAKLCNVRIVTEKILINNVEGIQFEAMGTQENMDIFTAQLQNMRQ